jgi:hypothetical protein
MGIEEYLILGYLAPVFCDGSRHISEQEVYLIFRDRNLDKRFKFDCIRERLFVHLVTDRERARRESEACYDDDYNGPSPESHVIPLPPASSLFGR